MTKVAISAVDSKADAPADPRFGRCNYFAVRELPQGQWDFLPNPALSARGGAGIKAAQELVNRKVTAVVTGNIGPNAVAVLEAAGIQIYTGADGTVQELLTLYQQGRLAPAARLSRCASS